MSLDYFRANNTHIDNNVSTRAAHGVLEYRSGIHNRLSSVKAVKGLRF